MIRTFGHHLSVEMLLLWLLESVVTFLGLCLVLGGGLPSEVGAWSGLQVVDQAATLAATIGAIAGVIGLYQPESFLQTRRLLIKALAAATVSLPAIWIVGVAVDLDPAGLFGHDRAWPLRLLAAWTMLLLATRLLLGRAMRMDMFTRRLLVLGHSAEVARAVEAIGSRRRGLFRVSDTMTIDHGAIDAGAIDDRAADTGAADDDIAALLHAVAARPASRRLWAIVATGGATHVITQEVIATCDRLGVRVLPKAEFWERHLGRVDPDRTTELTAPGDAAREVAARLVDLVLASGLLLATLPLMLLTALFIKLDSAGPVLYWQERVGLGGRVFALCKFRSMRTDAEAQGPVWAARRDSRVTRVGGVIRRVRIDELPQLLNIFRGEMSLIGPRPERPHFVAQLTAAIPAFGERARVKPGLTGWAQVNYPYGASVEDARAKLSYDLYYVKHRNPLLDAMILLSTVRVVLFQEGAR